MRKISVTLILLLLSTFIISQNYFPLIENNKKWDVLNVLESGGWPPFDTTSLTERFWTNGDSIIDSEIYKKVYSTTEEYPVNWELNCFMREDSDKKIWLRRFNEDLDYLMYDFTIESGDSILVGYFETVYIYVDSINTITINQEERKKYWFSCKARPYYHETWIEGIGSDKGICWSGSAAIIGGWFRLLCMSENQEIIYTNPNYESCYIITEINDNDKPVIQIYPNPVKDKLIIENIKNIEIESISLINLNGQIVKQFNSLGTQLDISDISSGLFFLKITYKNGELIEKIMIEK